MPVDVYSAKVTEKTIFNRKFRLIHLELVAPSRFKFLAGQYILMTVSGTVQKKSYSIASSPDTDHAIEILVDVTPHGMGSTYLENLQLGDTIEFRGPIGQAIIKDNPIEEHVVFVATGSGISPIRSMLIDLLINKQDTRQISLFWGLRHAEDMFWEEDFYQLSQDHPNFTFEVILSQPPETGWKLSQGYVTDLLAKRLTQYHNTGYYIFGNTTMVEDAKQLLISNQVNPDLIYHEKFY